MGWKNTQKNYKRNIKREEQKYEKILMVVLVLFVLLVNGCQCDLSHKHYYNDRGVCVCGDDIA